MEDLLESVADAVSALVMYSVEAEENNTAIPNIVPGANGVKAATDYLCGLAEKQAEFWKNLDQPAMRDKMFESCRLIREDCDNIVEAAVILKDEPFHFDGKRKLLHAAKEVMQHMVTLLQQADLYDVTRIVKLGNNCVGFVDKCAAIAGEENFKEDAQELVSGSGDLTRAAGKRIPNVDDYELKVRLEEAVKGVQSETNPYLQNVIGWLRDKNQREGVDSSKRKLIDCLEEIIEVTKLTAKSPFDLSQLEGLDLTEQPDDENLHEGLSHFYGDLLEAIKLHDPNSVKDAMDGIKKALGDQIQMNRDLANKLDDPEMRDALNRAMDDAEDALRNLMDRMQDAADAAMKNPTPENMKKLQDLMDEGERMLGKLKDPKLPPTMDDLAKRGDELEDLYQDLIDAVDRGNQDDADKALDAIKKGLNDQIDLAREIADGLEDPEMRRKLQEACDNAAKALDDLMNRMANAARNAIKNPHDKDARDKLANAIDEARNISSSLMDAAIPSGPDAMRAAQNKINDEFDKLRDAVARGDRDAADRALQAIRAGFKDQIDLAKAIARDVEDPAIRKALMDACNDAERALNDLMNRVGAAANNALDNPSPENMRRLDDAILDGRKQADGLGDLAALVASGNELRKKLRDLDGAVKGQNSKDAVQALKDANKEIDRQSQLANKVAQNSQDPIQRGAIKDRVGDLSQMPRALAAETKQIIPDPFDPQRVRDFAGVVDDVKKKSDAVIAAGSMNPEDQAFGNANRIDNELKDLRGLVNNGQMDEADQKMTPLEKDIVDQIKIARQLAERDQDPSRRKMKLDACSQLSQVVSGLVSSIKDGSSSKDNIKSEIDKARDLNMRAIGRERELTEAERAERERRERAKRAAARRDRERRERENAARVEKETMESAAAALKAKIAQNQAARQNSPIGKLMELAAEIAEQMAILDAASKSGDKKRIIEASRSIAGLSNKVVAEAKSCASSVADKKMRDRIIIEAQAAKNQAVQLKILASVKAATEGDDPTVKAQLVTCAKGMSKNLLACLEAAEVATLKV